MPEAMSLQRITDDFVHVVMHVTKKMGMKILVITSLCNGPDVDGREPALSEFLDNSPGEACKMTADQAKNGGLEFAYARAAAADGEQPRRRLGTRARRCLGTRAPSLSLSRRLSLSRAMSDGGSASRYNDDHGEGACAR